MNRSSAWTVPHRPDYRDTRGGMGNPSGCPVRRQSKRSTRPCLQLRHHNCWHHRRSGRLCQHVRVHGAGHQGRRRAGCTGIVHDEHAPIRRFSTMVATIDVQVGCHRVRVHGAGSCHSTGRTRPRHKHEQRHCLRGLNSF